MAGLFDGLPMKARTFAQGMFQIDAGATPEAAARKREMLAAMLMGGRKPQSVGEGVMDGVTRALSGWQMGRLNKAEGDKRKSESDAFRALRGTPPAPTGPLSVLGMIPDQGNGTPFLGSQQQSQQMPVNADPAIAGAFNGTSMAADVIKGFEGFRETPYWDVNALRTGYGSDTVTMADGTVRKVGDGTRVTREDAERDLQRRVGSEFMPIAARAVGEQTFGSLAPNQQAALASVAYNYGRIPGNLAKAVQTPGIEDDVNAFRALEGHNEGINADRRRQEAALYAGQGGMPTVPAYSGPPIADLQAAVTNPWLSQEERALAQSMLGQAMQQSDPLRQLQIQQAQIELQQSMIPEQPKPMEINGQLVNPATGEVLGDYRNPTGAGAEMPAEIVALEWRAQQAGLQPGTQEYQDFIMNGGNRGTGVPAGFAALDAQAKAGGLQPGTPEYQEFMLGSGAGERARATTTGKAQGEAELGLTGAAQKAERAIANLQAVRNDPALPGITGMIQGRLPPTTQAGTDLNVRIQQAQGQAFLEAFESLKGGGAITEIEGTKAEQAMARLNRAQSTEAYQAALDELSDILRAGVRRAHERAGKPISDAPVADPTSTGGAGSLTRAQFEAMPEVQRIVREGGATMDAAWAAYQRKYGGVAQPTVRTWTPDGGLK